MPNVFDIEIYQNFSLLMLRNIDTGQTRYFEQTSTRPFDVAAVRVALEEDTLVGFNSNRYDLPILKIACAGGDCATLKAASDDIIVNDMPPWRLGDKYPMAPLSVDHIDIMEPTPGVQVSLKSYAGRINAPRMQDLPIEPDATILPAQRQLLRQYCGNDLDVTARLYRKVEDRIKLREQMSEQYGIDLRSKSDAQVAEAVIKHEVELINKREVVRPTIAPGTSYRYKSPGFIKFQTPELQAVHVRVKAANYVVSSNGSIDIPKELADLKVKIGSSAYQMGIGGLHSTEKSTAHHSDDEHVLLDHDVASYYPNVILRLNLFPKHMGEAFLTVYRGIVERRLAAKKMMKASDDHKWRVEQESLKIVLNGSFGKFGSKYSILYSPDLLIQTTLTGQLALLMLIEQLEMHGIGVVSANTDGIVIKCPRSKRTAMEAIIQTWEWFSCFEMECTEYAALYSKDVNNYIAVKADGKVKLKGLYAEAGLMKNPTGAISVDAVIAKLTSGKDVSETIRTSRDITRFVTIRGVRGGGVQGGTYLGKTVRWYYSTNCRGMTINYKSNGNKVAKSEGARPIMDIPEKFPNDIDYDVYQAEAESILVAIGAHKKEA